MARCVVGHGTGHAPTHQAKHLRKPHTPTIYQFLGGVLRQSPFRDVRFIVWVEIPVDRPRACAAVGVSLPSQHHVDEPDGLQCFVECSCRMRRNLLAVFGDLKQFSLARRILLLVRQLPGIRSKSESQLGGGFHDGNDAFKEGQLPDILPPGEIESCHPLLGIPLYA